MRSTQFYGLSENALSWLSKQCKKSSYFQKIFHCYDNENWVEVSSTEEEGLISSVLEKDFEVSGMAGEVVYELRQYEMLNGSIVEEYVQATPWSSGPCIFLALRFQGTKQPVIKSLWKNNEIEKVL